VRECGVHVSAWRGMVEGGGGGVKLGRAGVYV
jgi:hypothetical protein